MTEYKRSVTIDDLFQLRVPSDVHLTPDGRIVAFVVSRADEATNQNQTSIWVGSVDGTRERLFDGETRDSSPRWSPDGEWLAFIREIEGVPQLAIIPAAQADAQPRTLTNLERGVSVPSWSPDSSSIAFLSAGIEDPEDSLPGIRSSDDSRRVIVADRLKHKLDSFGFYEGTRQHVFTVAVTDGTVRQVTRGDWDAAGPAWSPDGTRIAFTATAGSNADRSVVSDVYLTAPDGAEPQRVTGGNGSAAMPSWAPDGSCLAYYWHGDPGAGEGGNAHVWVSDLATSAARDLTPDMDTTATAWIMTDSSMMEPRPPAWSDDGQSLYFHALERGAQPLYWVTLDGNRSVVTSPHAVVDSFDVARDTLAYTLTTALCPLEIQVARPDGSGSHPLVDLNPWLQTVALQAPRQVDYAAADGLAVNGWYLPPVGESQAAPLILNVHGGPHGCFGNAFVLEFQVLAGLGYGVLYLNPRGSVGYGKDFAYAVRGDWGGKDFGDLMTGIDHAIQAGWADPARLGITGLSYGGFMTNWAVGQTDRFSAAVSHNGIAAYESHFGTSDFGAFLEWEFEGTPWDSETYRRCSPLTYVTSATTPLLLLHSEDDLRCPINESEQMFVAYRSQGKNAVLARYPGESHLLMWYGSPAHKRDRLERTVDWFTRYMPARRQSDERESLTMATGGKK